MKTLLSRRVSSHGLASHPGGAAWPVCVLWNSYVEHCSALYRGTCGTCGQSSYQQGIVILYVFVPWESSYNSFFPIVWYHLHSLSREYRRTLSSVGSIAWLWVRTEAQTLRSFELCYQESAQPSVAFSQSRVEAAAGKREGSAIAWSLGCLCCHL